MLFHEFISRLTSDLVMVLKDLGRSLKEKTRKKERFYGSPLKANLPPPFFSLNKPWLQTRNIIFNTS